MRLFVMFCCAVLSIPRLFPSLMMHNKLPQYINLCHSVKCFSMLTLATSWFGVFPLNEVFINRKLDEVCPAFSMIGHTFSVDSILILKLFLDPDFQNNQYVIISPNRKRTLDTKDMDAMTHITLRGIYPPLPTFFDEHEDMDIDTLQRHIAGLAETGIAGYVLMGSNGEAVHLSGEEREQVIAAAREAAGPNAQLIAGCAEQSTRATLRNCEQAARNGADVALILPPFYYKSAMNAQALIAHYGEVADGSPLPVVIYNMPANAAGIDLDTAVVCALAAHPNIIGVKDSAGNMAKLAEIVATTSGDHAAYKPGRFSVFAGSAGYLLPALAVGAVGAVAALANIFPREVCRVQELFAAGQLEEARQLQARLVPANAAITTIYNVPGLKAGLEMTAGYGGRPRSPLQSLSAEQRRHLATLLSRVAPVTP